MPQRKINAKEDGPWFLVNLRHYGYQLTDGKMIPSPKIIVWLEDQGMEWDFVEPYFILFDDKDRTALQLHFG